MTDRYENYAIHGVNYFGSEEQRCVCPQCPPHKSPGAERDRDLAVNIKKKTWMCHRCGWSGGLLKYDKQEFTKPVFKPIKVENAKSPSEKTMAYFKSRGITQNVVERNKITTGTYYFEKKDTPCLMFNYYIGDEIVNIKYRTIDKKFAQTKDGAKVFYKLNDIENSTDCIITEGEFDALSFEVAGFRNAVSVPDGGINENVKNLQTKLSYLDNCAEYFDKKSKIYLATDADPVGIRLREELARRLGKGRCYIVKFPSDCKDANEVLIKHGPEKLAECVTEAEPYPVEGIYTANDMVDAMNDLWEYGYPNGATTGWSIFDKNLQFFDSMLTVITGIPSHGKSNFLDNLMIRLAMQNGWKFGVFSPENGKLSIHYHRLCEIIIGKPLLPNYGNRMSHEEMMKAIDFLNAHIYNIIPKDEDFTLDNILECASYLVTKYGIKGLILDPWNTIIHTPAKGENETEYTKNILNKLTYFERNHGLHLFIVAHPTKIKKKLGTDRFEVPTLYDISGSANWYNKAEIGITVYRHFSKEKQNTTTVHIQKVKHRFMGNVGKVDFQFNANCQRYVPTESAEETDYSIKFDENDIPPPF